MATTKALRLPIEAIRTPATFRKVVDRETFRGYMLFDDGRVTAVGHVWDIKGKSLGANIYEVTLVRAF